MRQRDELKTITGGFGSGLSNQLLDLERAIAKQANRFSAFVDIGTQVSAARDVDQLLKTVMEQLTLFLRAEAATLFMHDPQTNELWSRVLKGMAVKEIRVPSSKGVAGHVFTNGVTVRIGDAYADKRFNPEIDRRSGFKTKSIVATPLRHMSGRILGVLQVLDRRSDAFDPEDQSMVEAVATQIAAVLDHVQLLEELQQRSEELALRVRDLDVLLDVEQAISSNEKQTDLLERILQKGIEVLKANAGCILIVEEDRNVVFVRNASLDTANELKIIHLQPGVGIAGAVAHTGRTVREIDAESLPHFDRKVAKKLGLSVMSVLCVPIYANGRSLGALEFVNKPGGFSEADERLAVLLSGQVGRALVLRRSREEEERKGRLAAIGQMLAGVLHDVRTPMTVITGYAEMMAEEPDAAARAEMADSILAQVELLSSMQKETLAFARGERSVLLRKVYLQNFVRELTTQLSQEFSESKIELRIQADYQGVARFDESKMRRLIFNLARNAMEAMVDGGRFVLQVARDEHQLLICAQDNGPGIPTEIEGRLFESFVTAGKKNGTGLGLAIVRKIAEEHGGSVICRSKIGKGTTFEVRIPLGVQVE